MLSWLRRLDCRGLGRLLRRWWWVYPAWLLLKWGTIFAVGYFAWDEWLAR